MYTARYVTMNYAENEHLLIQSGRGAESQTVFTEADEKDFALATCFIAGWYFKPAFDSEN
jgi:hypothetical protein